MGSVVIDKGSTARNVVSAGSFNVFYNSGKDSGGVSGIDPKDDPVAVDGSYWPVCAGRGSTLRIDRMAGLGECGLANSI